MKSKIWIALIAVYIVWGSTYLAIRIAVETMPPFLMAATRFLIAGFVLMVIRILLGDKLPGKKEWRSAAIVGLLLLLGGNGLVVWAEQRVASGVAALIVGTAPLWMVSLDAIIPGGKKPNRRTWIGILLGLTGIILLVGPWRFSGSEQVYDLYGILALLFAAFFWAIGSLYSRRAVLPESPLLGTGMEMLAGGAGLLVLGSVTGEWNDLQLIQISMRSYVGLIYLIVFGAWVGFVAYTWLLRNAPTPLVSTYAYVNPLVAIVLGSWIVFEPLTVRVWISALIVVSSVVLINTAQYKIKLEKRSIKAV